MLHWEEHEIDQLRLGEMGVKKAAVGDESVYLRTGGYFYLELSTEKEK